MDKSKFLEILRQSLIGEIDSVEIEKNIEYYDQYISRQSSIEEEKIISELGDPRLIAKSIIESNRAAKQKEGYSDRNSNSGYDNGERNQDTQKKYHNIFYTNLKWYHKLALILALLLIVIVIAVIGQLLVRILFIFGLPIIIILLLIMLLRRR